MSLVFVLSGRRDSRWGVWLRAGGVAGWVLKLELTVSLRAVIDVSVTPTNTTPESGCSC